MDVASLEGLEALTIGRLAGDLSLSKSGLFGHFGSKSELQLVTLRAAIRRFVAEVVAPAQHEEPGLRRLRALCAGWVSYLERGVFPGGCFLSATRMEFDDRPGEVRDEVALALSRWRAALVTEIEAAQQAGELPPEPAADDLAFEIDALVFQTNADFQLHRDAAVFARARRAIERRIGELPA